MKKTAGSLDRRICGLVLLTAAVLRGAALFYWRTSPFAAFSELSGLDMKTHLELGALFRSGQGVFACYRLLAAYFSPEMLVLLQSVGGAATALLAVFISLRLFGSRRKALFAGLAAAWYGNAVLYELATLPESVGVLLAAGSLAAVLQARRKHFAPGWSFLAGAACALLATGRPTGVLASGGLVVWSYWKIRRMHRARNGLWIAAGLLAVWLPVAGWNGARGWYLPVYGSNIAYASAVAASPELAGWSVVKPGKFSPAVTGMSFCRKIPKTLSIREIPDNLNYYFLKKKLGFMPFTLPVAALVISGIAGGICCLALRNRQGTALLVWCILLAAVFTAYYPAGRYRLALYPAAAVFAGFWLDGMWGKKRLFFLTIWAAVCLLEFWMEPSPEVRRSGDHTAWAQALLYSHGPSEDVDRELFEAVQCSGGGVWETVRMLQRYFGTNRLREARMLLLEYPGEDSYRKFYDAVLNLAEGDGALARRKLEHLSPEEIPELRAQYYYFLGESRLCTNDRQGAAAAFRMELENLTGSARKQRVQNRIRELETMPETSGR